MKEQWRDGRREAAGGLYSGDHGPDGPAGGCCVKRPREGWGLEMETLAGFPAPRSHLFRVGLIAFFKKRTPRTLDTHISNS